MKAIKQSKKIPASALSLCMLSSMAVPIVSAVDDSEFIPSEHMFSVVGGFNDWTDDVILEDPDGDGIYEGELHQTLGLTLQMNSAQ